MNGSQFLEIIAFFGTIVVFIPIFYRLKFNPLLAFIGAGILLGPHGLGLIKDVKIVNDVGELGLMFLMFSIGLDLSFHRFKIMRLYIFGFGVAQFLVTAFVAGGVAFALGKTLHESIIIGIGLSMSSTAVASRLLQAVGKLHTPSGRASIGILLLQDLAIIPVMVLLPGLANPGTTLLANIGDSMLKAVGAVTLIIVVGRMLMKPLFRIVASTESSEAFTATIFLVFLGTAWATHMAGLSISLGAFLGGMLIAETEFVHEVEAEISSISALLLGVFFLSVGMMIDVSYAWNHIFQILLLTVLVMTCKFVIMYLLERRLGLSHTGAIFSSVYLSQAGEFGFIIFNMAASSFHLMSDKTATQLQAVTALSMALTPFIGNLVVRNFAKIAKEKNEKEETLAEDEVPSNHVLLIGYGDVGQTVARLLSRNDIDFFVLDNSIIQLEKARKNQRRYLFGNATNEKILNTVNVANARAVVIAINESATVLQIVQAIRTVTALVPVFVRCDDMSRWTELMNAGATGVVSQAQECGIRLGLSVVLALGGEEQRVRDAASIMRQENSVNIQLPTV